MCSEGQKNIKFIYSGRDLYLEKLNVKFNLKWDECKSCGVYFSDQHPNIEKVYKDSFLYDAAYNDQEILEKKPLEKLSSEGQLSSFTHNGFWKSLDTLRDKNELEDLWQTNKAPWKIW